jgi:urease accessory protein
MCCSWRHDSVQRSPEREWPPECSPPTFPHMTNTGRHGRAELRFTRRGRRTILQRCYTTLPARVIRPFYAEGGGRAYVFLLTPTGGMLGGDRLDVHIIAEPGAQVCLTTASATKVHPAADAPAEQSLFIELAPGSALEYLPEPTILFRAARWRQRTTVHRAPDSRLLLAEGWSAGRVARQEVFQFSHLETTLEVYTEAHLALFDRMRIDTTIYPHQRLGLWAGRPHLLTMYLLQEHPPSQTWLQTLRTDLADHPALAGVSRLEAAGVVVRLLGDEAEAIAHTSDLLWRHVREGLWGEPWHAWRKL